MRSSNSAAALLLLLAGCSGGSEMARPVTATAPDRANASDRPTVPLPAEAGSPEGPAGTSGMGAARYDQVGYASWYGEELSGSPTASGAAFAPDAITAAHRTLPLNSYAEVTALDTGRTIVVLINDRGPGRTDREIDLSRGAAALLGMDGQPSLAVRVRGTVASTPDAAALAAGRPAAPRLDAPPALLAALRLQLRGTASPAQPKFAQPKFAQPKFPRPKSAEPKSALSRPITSPRSIAPTRAGASTRSATASEAHGYLVQVAAFSGQDRARALAKALGGRIEDGGGLYRVRLGPFADAASAERARDGAARRGYGDATIIVQPRAKSP